jgi:hypothetical protein
MKTTIESYQNQTKNLQDLTNLQLDDLYSNVYSALGQAIENDDIQSHDEILPILRTIKTEIQDRNEVTPTTIIKQADSLKTIKIQLTKIEKKRTRNHITSDYLYFLYSTKKITVEKFLSISNKKIEKSDTLRRVSNLLVHEHNRLNKVA